LQKRAHDDEVLNEDALPVNVLRLDHVGVMVDDLDAAVAWYSEHLGMSVRDRWQDDAAQMKWAHLVVGDVTIEFVQRPGLESRHPMAAGYHHLAIVVASSEQTTGALKEAGGTVVMPPSYFERHHMDWAFVQDPFGNIIEVISYRPRP
jgi:catechol 2,3-dioxygenase-like lactoylglutathione lyase family enzyme